MKANQLAVAGLQLVFGIFTVLVFCETSNANTANTHSPYPICIIGGGISGLTLSLLFQDKGYTVSLFEANSYFGGKVDTYKSSDGIILEKGPVFFTPMMNYTRKYMEMFNLSIIPYQAFDIGLFNPKNGGMYGKYDLNKAQKKRLSEIAKRYRKAYEANYVQYYSQVAPNSDLTLPISDFLRKYGIEDLRPTLAYIITMLGYGALEDVPSAYVLHLMPPDEMDLTFSAWHPFETARDGFATLMKRMAERVKSKYLNYEAINLKREDGKHEIQFLVNGRTLITRTCSKTILAFPPTLSNLLRIIPDLSLEEKKLFAKVKVNKYISSGHLIPSLKQTIYLGLIPKKILPSRGGDSVFPEMEYPYGGGEMIILGKSGKGTNPTAYQAYSWISGDYDNEPTESDLRSMKRKLHQVLKRLHPFYKTQFFDEGSLQYFPHVTTESMRSGFYKELENLQGHNSTYYATTLLTFETMNGAIEMAETIVNKYFS